MKGNIVEFSEKPIASIPFRKINWNNKNEVSLHNSISDLTQQFLTTKNKILLDEINTLINPLFEIRK